MDDFDQMWQSSSRNVWSFAYPLVVGIGVAWLDGLSWIRNIPLRRVLKAISTVVLSVLACGAASAQIELKWQIRAQYAIDHSDRLSEDQKTAAFADGANRVFGPIIYGFQASLIFVATLFVIRAYRHVAKTTSYAAINGLSDKSEVPPDTPSTKRGQS